MSALFSPLRRIVVAYTINELGTWFGYLALIVAVYDHTHSPVYTASLLIAARFLPALVVPAVVARAETSRRGSLSAFYLVEASATAVLVFLLGHFWIPAIFLMAAINGMASLAATSLLRATAAEVGLREEMAKGLDLGHDPVAVTAETSARKVNATLNAAFTPTVVVGPALAGVVVASAGGQVALLIDAFSFLFCAVSLRRMTSRAADDVRRSVLDLLSELWQHLQEVRPLRILLATEAVGLIFFASVEPVEVVYAKSTLHTDDQGYGLLMGAWGVGMVIGSIIFSRSKRRPLAPLVAVGTLGVGIGYAGMAAAPGLAAACVVSVIGGAGNGIQWVSLVSLAQQLTPNSLHARLFSAIQSMGAICPAAGFALGGTIAAASSPRIALCVAGIAATCIAMVFLRVWIAGVASTNAPRLATDA
jgi:hypothetical protein